MVPMQAAWGFQCAQTFPVYRTTTMDSYLYLDRLHRWSICPNQSYLGKALCWLRTNKHKLCVALGISSLSLDCKSQTLGFE